MSFGGHTETYGHDRAAMKTLRQLTVAKKKPCSLFDLSDCFLGMHVEDTNADECTEMLTRYTGDEELVARLCGFTARGIKKFLSGSKLPFMPDYRAVMSAIVASLEDIVGKRGTCGTIAILDFDDALLAAQLATESVLPDAWHHNAALAREPGALSGNCELPGMPGHVWPWCRHPCITEW